MWGLGEELGWSRTGPILTHCSWHSIQPGHLPAAVFPCHKCGTGQNKLHGVSFLECQDRRRAHRAGDVPRGTHGAAVPCGSTPWGVTTRLQRPGRGAHAARGVGVCVADAGLASLLESCTRWCETPRDTRGVRGRLWGPARPQALRLHAFVLSCCERSALRLFSGGWGLGRQHLNHFAFSLARLLLTRSRWET